MADLDLRAVKALAKRIGRQPGKVVARTLAKRIQARLTIGKAYHNTTRARIRVRVFPRFRRPTIAITAEDERVVGAMVSKAIRGKLAEGVV